MRNFVVQTVVIMGIISWFARSANADWVPTNGPYGANVESLEMMGSKLFVATHGGGVYTTMDNGENWKESNTGITNMYMRTLGFFNGTVLAGTNGDGVFRSTDSGTTWNRVATGPANGYVQSFVINGTTIYAGTYGGMFRSSDNGVSWNAVDTNFKKITVWSMASSGNTIFAGTSDSGVIRSTDNGSTWSFINPEPEFPMGSAQDVATNGTTVFAARNYSTSSTMYRSIDNGTTWSKVYSKGNNTFVNSIVFGENVIFAATTIGVLLSTDNGLTWTKSNTGLSDTIVKALKVNGTTIFAGTENGGVFRSTNNGGNWTAVNTGINNISFRIFSAKGNTLFAMAGRSGGFRSTDNGTSWTPVTIASSNPYCFSFLECGDTIFAGTLQGAFFSTDTGTHWTSINFGFEGVAVHTWVKHGNELFIGTPRGIFSTSNGGSSWKLIGLGSIYDLSVASLQMCGDDLIAATYKHGIYLLTKGDTSWSALNTGLKDKNINCLAISGNTVLAGSSTYNIFRSHDKGMTWTDTIKSISGISSFLVLDTAILASGKGVYCSKDTGTTWTKVITGLPTATANSSITSIAVCGDNLFAGVNAKGVWRRPIQEILTTPMVQVVKKQRRVSPYTFSINAAAGRKIRLELTLDQPGKVWGAVYDLSGRQVTVIVNQTLHAGIHHQIWDASGLSNGCYLVRVRVGGVGGVRMVRLLE